MIRGVETSRIRRRPVYSSKPKSGPRRQSKPKAPARSSLVLSRGSIKSQMRNYSQATGGYYNVLAMRDVVEQVLTRDQIVKNLQDAVNAGADYRNWYERNIERFKYPGAGPKVIYSNDPWLIAQAALEANDLIYGLNLAGSLLTMVPGLGVFGLFSSLAIMSITTWAIPEAYKDAVKKRLRAAGYDVRDEVGPSGLESFYQQAIDSGQWEFGRGIVPSIESLNAYIKAGYEDIQAMIKDLQSQNVPVGNTDDLIRWLQNEITSQQSLDNTYAFQTNQRNKFYLEMLLSQLNYIKQIRAKEQERTTLEARNTDPNYSNMEVSTSKFPAVSGIFWDNVGSAVTPQWEKRPMIQADGIDSLSSTVRSIARSAWKEAQLYFPNDTQAQWDYSSTIQAILLETASKQKMTYMAPSGYDPSKRVEREMSLENKLDSLWLKRDSNVPKPNRALTAYETAMIKYMMANHADILYGNGFRPDIFKKYYTEVQFLEEEIKSEKYSGAELDRLKRELDDARKRQPPPKTEIQALEEQIRTYEKMLEPFQFVLPNDLPTNFNVQATRDRLDQLRREQQIAQDAYNESVRQYEALVKTMYPGNTWEVFGNPASNTGKFAAGAGGASATNQ